MSEEKLIELFNLAESEGDEDTAIKALEKLKELRQTQHQASTPQKALGGAEVAGTLATGLLAEPVSGLVGLGGLAAKGVSDTLQMIGLDRAAQFMDPGDLKKLVEGVQSTLTHNPRTDEGQRQIKAIGDLMKPLANAFEKASRSLGDPVLKATGSPALAATAASIPEGALEIIPGLTLPKGLKAGLKSKANRLMEKARRIPEGAETNAQRIADTITEANLEDITLDADLDADFFKAAEELGINTAPVASFASRNQQFIEIEQMLSSIQGSSLSRQAADFISETSDRASRLIDELGGSRRGELSERFAAETSSTVDDLFNQADQLYDVVDSGLDKTAKVDAPQTMNFVDSFIAESGGKPSPLVAKIKKELETVRERRTGYTGEPVTATVKQPTYGRLVQLRQEIGQAIGKGTGPFKDANTGFLKQLYSKLRQDQDSFARQSGVFDELKAADQLVIQRKVLEDNLKDLLGSRLQKSIEPVVSGAVSGLTKGKMTEFDNIIKKIPEQYRQDAVVTALREQIGGRGATQGDFSYNNFTKFMGRLSDTAKERIYKHLPDNGKSLESLYTLSRGINNAKSSRRDTGVVQASLNMFDKERGYLSRLLGKPVEVGIKAYAGVKGGPAGGALASNLIDDLLNQRTARSKSASELLGSAEFREMMTQAVRDGVHQGSVASSRTLKRQKLIEKSQAYQRWADTLTNTEKSRLAHLGLAQFLLPEQETLETEQ